MQHLELHLVIIGHWLLCKDGYGQDGYTQKLIYINILCSDSIFQYL